MPDVTVKSIDDMEAIYGLLARRARAELRWRSRSSHCRPTGRLPQSQPRLRCVRGAGRLGTALDSCDASSAMLLTVLRGRLSAALIEMPHAN